jgi:hypothetical protein
VSKLLTLIDYSYRNFPLRGVFKKGISAWDCPIILDLYKDLKNNKEIIASLRASFF